MQRRALKSHVVQKAEQLFLKLVIDKKKPVRSC